MKLTLFVSRVSFVVSVHCVHRCDGFVLFISGTVSLIVPVVLYYPAPFSSL